MATPDRPPAYHPLVRALAAALKQRCGVTPGATVLVAVSGGADSVALLRALAILAPRRGWGLRLIVAHVQHHLRVDRHAEADARFVADLARRLRLPFVRADLNPGDRRDRPTNTEAWARQARYEALLAMARAAPAPFVAVAHHADDQLETLLMRLLRGASLRGLSAMRWRRRLTPDASVRLIRPMLAVDRATIEAFLRELRQPRRHDHTNHDMTRLRARLRRRVTPELRRLRPDVAQRATRLADRLDRLAGEQARAERAALRHVTWSSDGDTATLDRAVARAWPAAVLAGALRRALARLGAPRDRLTSSAITPIARAVRDHHGGVRRFPLARGLTLTLTRHRLLIAKP